MNKQIGYLYLVITFMIWGSLYVVSKYALAAIPPVTILMFRYLISVMLLAVLLMRKEHRKIEKKDIKYFVLIGALGYFASIACQLIGTNLIDASLASLINAMNPITISIMAAIFLKENLTRGKICSIVLSVLGVYVVLGHATGSINILGIIASVCSVLLWSGVSIVIRKVSGKYNPIQIALYGMSAALGFNIPAAIVELQFKPHAFTVSAVLALLYIAIVCTAVAHTLWNKSLSTLDASTCSMLYPLQPLFSVIFGILLLHEKITANFVTGGLMISAGIVVAVISGRTVKNNNDTDVNENVS